MQNGVSADRIMTCDVCGSDEPHNAHNMAAEQDAPLPVPRSVSRQQIREAVTLLGFDPDKSSTVWLGTETVLAVVHVDGTRYPKGLMDAGLLVPGTMVEIPVKDGADA